jgi:Spy/CpxP family protein refolding chaperone
MKYAASDSLTPAQKARLAEFRKSLPLPKPSQPVDSDKQLIHILRRSQWDLPFANRTYGLYMRESSRAKRLLEQPSEEMIAIIVSDR